MVHISAFSKAERAEFNQYWYSASTIESIVLELKQADLGRVAFLSTPSLFFALDDPKAVLFDFDASLGAQLGERFVHFDFRDLASLPTALLGQFDAVVVDPPFISAPVWEAYAEAARKLGKSDGPVKFLGTTVQENGELMKRLFGASEAPFKPAIPTLVYQYSLFANFSLQNRLAAPNPELA